MTYEALESIRVIRRWRDVSTNHVLRCFDNPEGLNYRVLA
jgi:hypothetical protein